MLLCFSLSGKSSWANVINCKYLRLNKISCISYLGLSKYMEVVRSICQNIKITVSGSVILIVGYLKWFNRDKALPPTCKNDKWSDLQGGLKPSNQV